MVNYLYKSCIALLSLYLIGKNTFVQLAIGELYGVVPVLTSFFILLLLFRKSVYLDMGVLFWTVLIIIENLVMGVAQTLSHAHNNFNNIEISVVINHLVLTIVAAILFWWAYRQMQTNLYSED